MKTYTVTETSLIDANAETVYAVLADYHNGHPQILPKKYFSSLRVEAGGHGAGTRLRFTMHAPGRSQDFHVAITELVPGRTLVETELDSGVVTTFTVLPLDDARSCRVTITTELKARPGMVGAIEKSITSMFLRRVYAQELELLSHLVNGKRER